jgi:hypothetical protein
MAPHTPQRSEGPGKAVPLLDLGRRSRNERGGSAIGPPLVVISRYQR